MSTSSCTSCGELKAPGICLKTFLRHRYLFQSLFLLHLVATSSLCVFQLYNNGEPGRLQWLLALLTVIPTALLAFSNSNQTMFVWFGKGTDLGSIYFAAFTFSVAAVILSPVQLVSPGTVAFVSSLAWALFDVWYSSQNVQKHAAWLEQPNAHLPDFALFSPDGKRVDAGDIIGNGKHSSLLVFYRGNWCAVCMTQINDMLQHASNFEAEGIHVFLICAQPIPQQRAMATRVQSAPNFHVLMDHENRLASSWGLLSLDATPVFKLATHLANASVPAALLVSKRGLLIKSWISRDFRLRVDSSMVLAAFEQQESGDEDEHHEPRPSDSADDHAPLQSSASHSALASALPSGDVSERGVELDTSDQGQSS